MEEYSHVSFACPSLTSLISASDNYSSIEEGSHDCNSIKASLGYAHNDPHASLRWVMCDNNYNGKIAIKSVHPDLGSESFASGQNSSLESFVNRENHRLENYPDTDSKDHVNFMTIDNGTMLPTFCNLGTHLVGDGVSCLTEWGNTATVLPVFPSLTKDCHINEIPIKQNNALPLMSAASLRFSTNQFAEQPDSNQVNLLEIKDVHPLTQHCSSVNEPDDSMCQSTCSSHERNKDNESEIKGVGVDIVEMNARDECKRKSESVEGITSTRMETNADEDNSKRRKRNDTAKNSSGKSTETSSSRGSKPPEIPKPDVIHVRARRGQATDSHSLAERIRREKISERMKYLQDLVPGCNKVTGKAVMLDEVINYVRSLQRQVEFLSMKLAAVSTRMEFNVDNIFGREVCFSNNIVEQPTFVVHARSTWT